MELKDVTYRGGKITDNDLLASLPSALADFMGQVNGIVAFNGGLHIRGCVIEPSWHSIRYRWTGNGSLSALYDQVLESDIPFGEDCLGDQFLLRDLIVYRLSGETGEIENLGLSFDQFMKNAIADPMEFLSLHPLQQFINEGGQLTPGELLSVYPPFCLEESANGVSLKSVSTADRIDALASFCQQLKNIPDGHRVKIEVFKM